MILCMLLVSMQAIASNYPEPSVCDTTITQRALTLDDAVNLALCNNPQTRLQWSNVRAQAALVGSARASYLPSLTLSGGDTRYRSTVSGTPVISGNTQKAGLTAGYLLYDFGGRSASLEAAQQTLIVTESTRDAVLQMNYLNAVQAYFSLLSARANVAALLTAETLAKESLDAALARYQSGTATPADRLQATTALSQARLNRITAEGNAAIAAGTLANQLGYPATQPMELASVDDIRSDPLTEKKIGDLIAEAMHNRPDLLAAEAQIKAAEAQVGVARATGMPNINLTAGSAYTSDSNTPNNRNDSIGVSLSFPLFSGMRPTYQTRSAEAQVQARVADRDRVANQVGLDVWTAYQGLQTNSQALQSAGDLVASAEQSERMISGRYKAGLGNMIDMLTAQSTLASARQQLIAARFNFISRRFALAQAIGSLDISTSEAPVETHSNP
jgi:TolC family type I secretion outer membrane protein